MKRLLLILILLFPILTLVFWVYRGDTIRPHNGSNGTVETAVPDRPGTNDARTNFPAGQNPAAQTNKSNLNELPAAK